MGTLVFSFLSLVINIKSAYTLAYYCIASSFVISLYQSLTAEQSKATPKETAESAKAETPKVVSQDPKQKVIDFVNSLKPLIKPAQNHATTPYVLLSLAYLFVLPRNRLTLIPYMIFATFHALNYTKTFVLPRLGLNAQLQSNVNMVLQVLNNRFHAPAFKAAVWSQLTTLSFSVFNLLINFPLNLIGYGDGHTITNFISVAVWFSFISTVVKDNLLMKSAINDVVAFADGVTMDPRVPVQVRDAWLKAKHIITYKDLNSTK